jgi:hypothetical protein
VGNNEHREYIDRLARVIQELHGSGAVHINTESVHEVFQGKTVWEGDVEVFSLTDESKATVCYAWSYQDGSVEHFVAVLNVPPVNTAADAVKAYIVGEAKKRKAN